MNTHAHIQSLFLWSSIATIRLGCEGLLYKSTANPHISRNLYFHIKYILTCVKEEKNMDVDNKINSFFIPAYPCFVCVSLPLFASILLLVTPVCFLL